MSSRANSVLFLSVLFLVPSFAEVSAGRTILVSDSKELQRLFSVPVESLEIRLLPGEYHLVPSEFVDSTCGNCENSSTSVKGTFGLHITGKWVRIIGPEDKSAVIHTHAGYGLFFNNCSDALIENTSITGGERDADGNATNAAIVAKNSTITIRSNRVFDNIGDSTIVMSNVVGIMGVCGREKSHLVITNNEIIRNSWDGIALYRDAEATIERNVIDGVDKARGKQVGGGRGVAIGVTWNARATIKGNLVKRYWKGIGLFVDAKGVVQENIVEDILTWGIALWDADKGKPEGIIENNVIYKTGACGASITRSAEGENPGRFVRNIIARTAQDPKYDSPDYYCYQCALALHAVPETFRIENNLFHNNRRATDDLPDHDTPREKFMRAIEATHRKLSMDPILRQSDFVMDFSINN